MKTAKIVKTGTYALVALILILPGLSHAGNPIELYPLPEEMYPRKWCADHGGVMGLRMPDGTTADCVTATHVVDFQFAPRWAEAIGRALYYSSQSWKKAGIVLIVKEEKDRQYWTQLNSTIDYFKLPIDTWKME